jgi:uronate dehydrogenase
MARTINRVLITGAGGRIGGMLRTALRGRYERLILSDIIPLKDIEPHEDAIACDLKDGEAIRRACRDVDAIIHCGGNPRESPWPEILEPNIIGSINVWEAARHEGVDRIVYASSNHAIAFTRRSETLDHRGAHRPDCRYGLSKAFMEDLAYLYAYKYGVRGFGMRIGSFTPTPTDARALSTWISHRDMAQLVSVGLTADYRNEIVFGISRNKRAWWDNSNAYRLGYDPQDESETYAAEVGHIRGDDPIAEEFQGSRFVSTEFTADPNDVP